MARGVEFEFAGTERFEIQRRLGAGGMGIVYEVFDRERNTKVALKTLRKVDAQALYRLKQEFRSLQDLEHPNLVSLGELIEDGGNWFFTMELVDGMDFLGHVRPGADIDSFGTAPTEVTLSAPLTRLSGDDDREPIGDRFDEASLRPALIQLALGLHALHVAGKIHRDIKPSNIRVTPEGRVVLLDFGLIADAVADSSSEAQVVGTAAYMAPEQAMSGQPRAEADWYSFGVVLFEALTGRLPFRGKTSFELLTRKQQEVAPAPSEQVPEVPQDLDELCVELLRKAPERRPTGAAVLARLGVDDPSAQVVDAPPVLRAVATTRVDAPFVGRVAELQVLRDAFAEVRRRRAVTVSIHGESGLGKSELIRRFTSVVQSETAGTVVLAGRCYERESVPYKAFDGIVDALSLYMLGLSPADAAVLVPLHASLLPRVFPVLGRVEAIARAPRHEKVQDPHEIRARVFAALRELMTRLAERRIPIIIIDDLQWADGESMLLLEDLMRPPDAPPLLLLISARADKAGANTDSLPGDVRRIDLEPLGDEAARQLAAMLVQQSDVGEDTDVVAIAAEAAGHPMYIAEMVRHASLAADPSVPTPARLDDAIWSRVSQLDSRTVELLQLVSLAGAPLPQATVCAAAAMEASEFAKRISVLRVANLVRGGGGRTTDVLEPYHDRVREAVLAHFDSGQRAAAHERLGTALEASSLAAERPELLLRHLELAGKASQAAYYALEGAKRASEALAFDRSAELYRTALRLGSHSDQQAQALRLSLAEALANAGRGAESANAYLEVAASADPDLRSECQTRAAEQLLVTGHFERGLEAIGAALADVGIKFPATPRRALMSMLWQRVKLKLRGLRWTEREESEIPEEDLARIDVCQIASDGLGMVDPFRGADFMVRGLLMALRAGERVRVGRALAAEAMYHGMQGGRGLGRARELLDETRRIAARSNDAYLLAGVTGVDGFLHYVGGEFRIAAERTQQSEQILLDNKIIYTAGLNNVRFFRLLSLRSSGQIGELGRLFDVYIRDATRRGDLFAETSMRGAASLVWLARDRPDRVRRDLADSSWAPPEGQYHLQDFYALLASTELALYEGTVDEGYDELVAGYRRLERTLLLRIQMVRVFARGMRARIAVAKGDARRAKRYARRLEREGIGYASVFAGPLRAALAAQRGDVEHAVELLDDAIVTTENCDMPHVGWACRRRRGELLGGDEGRAILSDVDVWMESQGIRESNRFAEVFAPGFDLRRVPLLGP